MRTDSKVTSAPVLSGTLARYEVVTNLGQGGMAEVFLAVRRGPFASNKLLVIKKLKAAPDGDPELVHMFVDEARIAMRLSHPNVVSTFDFVAEGDEFYLTMEFLDGPSLLQATRTVGREKFPVELQIWILTQVLAGLGYAHQLRDFDGSALEIVHRDVTPSNVILTHGGGVKLVDFGIAKVAGAVAVTQSGTMKGKIGYASPEQCLGKPTTMASDLYSVGVMLWEAMARKRRTVGETPAAVYQARIAGTERAIEDVWPEAPPSLARSVKRALATAPENRYQSAHEFQRDLEEYLSGVAPATFGPRALADFLTLHFGQAREALHRTIESRVTGELRGLPMRLSTPTEMTPSAERSLRNDSLPLAASERPAPKVPESGPPPRPPDRRAALVVAALAVMGVATILATRGGTPRRNEVAVAAESPAGPSNGPSAASRVTALPPPPSQPRPPAVVPLGPSGARPAPSAATSGDGRVDVKVVVKPRVPTARVALDGEALAGYPYAARRPKDGGSHLLSVTADGYERVERSVTLDRDLRLTLKLNPVRSDRRSAQAATDERAARARAPARVAASAPAVNGKAPPVSVEPTELEQRPGMDLRHPSSPARGARHIDEKDPYSP